MNYHYLKKIVNNKTEFNQMIQKRDLQISYDTILQLFNDYKTYLSNKETYNMHINSLTNKIKNNLNNKALIEELKVQIHTFKQKLSLLITPDLSLVDNIPNFLQQNVPHHASQNIVIKEYLSKPTNKAMAHYDFPGINILDACKISGSRFVIFSGDMTQLFKALKDFFLDELKKYNFKEYILPYMVLDKAMYNSGNLPKFKDESFQSDKYRLIPTAEVPLLNMFTDSKTDNTTIRLCAFTPCFRSEVGSAGKDTRGIKRLHQFHKVEMVSITSAENSEQEHKEMLKIEEAILQKLGIHYRVVLLCSGDTGFHSSKTYDIEVFMPSTNQYMEISSCSNCLDFQSIRTNIRNKNQKFKHTLNGSAFPLERMIAAIVENFQIDNKLIIPKVLTQYIN